MRLSLDFIRRFPVIRVGITVAPGFGHQAYAITVIKRLRALGYKGRFEVLYDPGAAQRLEAMLPGFEASGPAQQELRGLGATLIAWDPLDAAKSGLGSRPMALGLMGGDDKGIAPEQLNVDALIRVQPTEASAQRRINAMRLMRDVPEGRRRWLRAS